MRVFNGDSMARRPSARGRRGVLGRLCLAGVLFGALAACQPERVAEAIVDVPPQSVPDAAPPEVEERIVEVAVDVPNCRLPAYGAGTQYSVEAWAVPDPRYNVGEPLSLQMRVGAPSYMNVFHVSTSCKVTRLMHNRPLQQAEILDFPLRGSGIQMIVKPPAGNEAFYFVATREPIDVLAAADLMGSGEIVALDLSPAQFYTRLDQITGRINPADLSMTTLRTSIVGN